MTLDEQRLFDDRGERLENYRQRVVALEAEFAKTKKDSARLTYIIDRSNNGEDWLCDSVWDEAPFMEECTDGQLSIRAYIDSEMGAE